jgi:hypothetical protein
MEFDAARIAETEVREGEDPLETVVFQALGAASICWERMNDTGVFDDQRAKAIGESLVGWLREQRRTAVELEAGQRLVLLLDGDVGVRETLAAAESVRAWQADPEQRVLVANATALVIRDDTEVTVGGDLGDGCVAEHSPGSNPACTAGPAGLRVVDGGVDG